MSTIEFRVRPITRFVVTRYECGDGVAGSETRGEYENFRTAYDVGYALAKAEADRLGLPPGDTRVMFPSSSVESDASSEPHSA